MTPKRKIQRGLVWAVAGASAFGLGIGATSLVSAASSSTTDTATTADRAFTPHIPPPPRAGALRSTGPWSRPRHE